MALPYARSSAPYIDLFVSSGLEEAYDLILQRSVELRAEKGRPSRKLGEHREAHAPRNPGGC